MKFNLKKNWIMLVYAGAIVLLFLGLGLHFRESSVLKRLKTVQGQVTHREIYTTSTGAKTSYHPLVKYGYRVDNKSYESSSVGLAKVFYSTKEDAEKTVEQYPPGKVVTVHYDPSDPSTAYLELQGMRNSEGVFVLLFLYVVFVIPVSFVIDRVQRKRQKT
jgi:Protein of unknown function (DUF3592)